MKKKLVITPYQRWSYENVNKDYFIGFDVKTYDKYIEGVFITNNNYNDMGFESSDTITLEDLPYFERIEVEKDGNDVETIDRKLKEKYNNLKDNEANSLAEDVFGDNFITHEVVARGYSQGDYQSWLFVFRKPKSKKRMEKLENIINNLEELSKVFTASDFNFRGEIIVEKENETCIKQIDDFDDLYVYNDDSRLPEDDEDLQKTIEEVKKKYGIEEIEIKDIIYG